MGEFQRKEQQDLFAELQRKASEEHAERERELLIKLEVGQSDLEKRRKEHQIEHANLQQRLEEEQQKQELVFQQQRDEAAREQKFLEEQRRIWEEERCRLEEDARRR